MRPTYLESFGLPVMILVYAGLASGCPVSADYPLDQLWREDYSLSGLDLGFSYPPMADEGER